jgi:hypothetical protein
MNDDAIDEGLDDEGLDDEDLVDEDLDDEDLEDELDDELVDDSVLPEGDGGDEDAAVDDEDDEDEVPTARAKRPGTTEDDEEDDVNPDDVEADLDRILKYKIASGDDEDEDEEPEPVGEPGERVAAKGADEFTCNTCFLIVHPRQFGRAGNLTCPEGYDPCPSIKKVEAMLKRAKKG